MIQPCCKKRPIARKTTLRAYNLKADLALLACYLHRERACDFPCRRCAVLFLLVQTPRIVNEGRAPPKLVFWGVGCRGGNGLASGAQGIFGGVDYVALPSGARRPHTERRHECRSTIHTRRTPALPPAVLEKWDQFYSYVHQREDWTGPLSLAKNERNRLPEELVRRIKRLSGANKRTKMDLVIQVLDEGRRQGIRELVVYNAVLKVGFIFFGCGWCADGNMRCWRRCCCSLIF